MREGALVTHSMQIDGCK